MAQMWAGTLQVIQLSQLQSLATIPISSPGGAGSKLKKKTPPNYTTARISTTAPHLKSNSGLSSSELRNGL